MARKDLLKSLMDGSDPPHPHTVPPRPVKGAIGAVSQSIAELRGRAIVEVPVDLIDDAGLSDRLERDDGIEELAASIREYGQQVPVLLRHSPNIEGRYEIVYGRRRVAAMRLLNLPVKAMVRDLNSRDLIVAQGQENAARKDLSFIEKANFAQQMVQQGFERKVICDALHLDKTVISRMLSVIDGLPDGLVQLIGAAPSAGRDRWLSLSARTQGRSLNELQKLTRGESSDVRFITLFEALAPERVQVPPTRLTGAEGARLGEVKRSGKGATLRLTEPAFSAWLVDHIEEIHRLYLKGAEE